MSGRRLPRYYDLERSVFACNDKRRGPIPSVDQIAEELLAANRGGSRFALSAMASEPDAGCHHWPVIPVGRFEGPWNHTLRNPILILGNMVRLDECLFCVEVYVGLFCLGGSHSSVIWREKTGLSFGQFIEVVGAG